MRTPAVILGVLIMSAGSADTLEPWASNTDPTDVPRTHTEQITAARHEYSITHGGTMDGANCRPPIGYGAWHQSWESNRAVRLENVGDTDIVNPWLSNGRNNFRTIEEIVAGALEPGMTEKQKAIAVWRWEMDHRFHATTGDSENNDPVKVFNVYGYTLCGNDAICLSGLWRTAGLKVRPARPTGHSVTEVFYDGEWHLLDGDEHCIFLLRDNETIASEHDVVRDHDLIKRTHTYGILAGDDRNRDEFSASLYIFEGEGGGSRDCVRGHTMNMTLRPGEALTWRWGHLMPPKQHGRSDVKAGWGQNASDKICNGLWEYRPDFSTNLWRKGAVSVDHIVAGDDGLRAEPGKTGAIVWNVRSPYVFVGGKLEVEGSGTRFAVSWDGKEWQDVAGDLDELFPPAGPARHEYLLRCELAPDASLKSLRIVNDIQMAPLSLPGMMLGDNTFVYTDETQGRRAVRMTHEWVERSASRPPEAPPAPIFPADGAEVNGTQFAFSWREPADPDGDKITDYHFELSDRPDMKWPLSPNFEKLVSHTADRGKAQYTLPYVGLLTPERVYYWRVRAKEDKGVWGPWSGIWRFTSSGPAPPIDVRLELDDDGVGVLRWKANPVGRRPVKYRVYGSDEKGFTISDEPYKVNVGNQKEKLPTPFPANFVTETETTELIVLGPDVRLPNANKAFCRIIAVDEQGKRSWSSDYASAPRPLVYSQPPLVAQVGAEYRYEMQAIRSLGDLRCRTIEGKCYNANFWHIERPEFALEEAPDWLTVDRSTGVLSGTPEEPGKVRVVATATIEDMGTGTQRFEITVRQ